MSTKSKLYMYKWDVILPFFVLFCFVCSNLHATKSQDPIEIFLYLAWWIYCNIIICCNSVSFFVYIFISFFILCVFGCSSIYSRYKFYLPLFLGIAMYNNKFQEQRQKSSEPQHIQYDMSLISSYTVHATHIFVGVQLPELNLWFYCTKSAYWELL